MKLRVRLAAAIAATALSVAPTSVLAQAADNYVGSVDEPRSFTTERPQPTDQLGQRVSKASAGGATLEQDATLAVTGGDVIGLTAIGLAALGSGALLVRRSRRVHPQV